MCDSLESIGIVHSSGLPEIVDQILTLVSLAIRVVSLAPEAGGYLVHLLVLECLPEVVRQVEHDSLQEEHEGDPLVVGVHLPVILVLGLRADPLVWSVHAVNSLILGCKQKLQIWGDIYLCIKLTRYGEGRHDPAVRVEDVAWDAVVDAGDGVANEVIAGDEDA